MGGGGVTFLAGFPGTIPWYGNVSDTLAVVPRDACFARVPKKWDGRNTIKEVCVQCGDFCKVPFPIKDDLQ